MRAFMVALLVAAWPTTWAQDATDSCMVSGCPAGTFAVTYGAKDDPYFACPSRDLERYTNGVLGLIAIAKRLGGPMPEIDPETGEPKYQDETKAYLDMLRHDAGVRTLDQAVALCRWGPHKKRVRVLVDDEAGSALRVADAANPKSVWWMPRASADPAK